MKGSIQSWTLIFRICLLCVTKKELLIVVPCFINFLLQNKRYIPSSSCSKFFSSNTIEGWLPQNRLVNGIPMLALLRWYNNEMTLNDKIKDWLLDGKTRIKEKFYYVCLNDELKVCRDTKIWNLNRYKMNFKIYGKH